MNEAEWLEKLERQVALLITRDKQLAALERQVALLITRDKQLAALERQVKALNDQELLRNVHLGSWTFVEDLVETLERKVRELEAEQVGANNSIGMAHERIEALEMRDRFDDPTVQLRRDVSALVRAARGMCDVALSNALTGAQWKELVVKLRKCAAAFDGDVT